MTNMRSCTGGSTNAVVAICVVAVPGVAVGAVGTPENAGLARFAFNAKPFVVKAVVATWVVDVPGEAVGAAGTRRVKKLTRRQSSLTIRF